MKTFEQTPDARLDYIVKWINFDPITLSSWTIEGKKITGPQNDLLLDTPSFNSDETQIWVSEGTVDVTYILTNHIRTQTGREASFSFMVKIIAKYFDE